MPQAVNSAANKILLAQILEKHPLATLNNIHFQQLITQETNRIHRQRFQFHSDLTLMNKEVLKRITDIGKQMAAPLQKPTLPPAAPVSKNFESRLKEQQDNFLKLARPSKPKDIDFSDKLTEGAIPTIDTTLQEREKELRAIMKDYQGPEAAKQWIENEDVQPADTPTMTGNIADNTITIDPAPVTPVKPDPLPDGPQKRVTFEIQEGETRKSNKPAGTLSFLNKLKKKDTTLTTIVEEKNTVSTDGWQKISGLLLQNIELQKQTLAAVTELSKSLQTQSSQSPDPAANSPSK